MIYLLLGLVLILFGCFHMFDEIGPIDTKIVNAVQQLSNREPLLRLFREIWFLGRTSFSLIVMIFLVCIDWKIGLVSSGVFLIIAGIEFFVKSLYNRKRPHASSQGIAMLQPIEPLDSSFPSGDALRVWYLALILPAVAGGNPFFLAAAVSLAFLVTLGRMAMGVHYLTDTLAGAGLGVIGAGTAIWIWHFFAFL